MNGAGGWATAVLVIVGWVVVHLLSAARDRDKARREMISKALDGIAESLSAIHDSARGYHLSARDFGAELRLKNSLQDFAMCLVNLTHACAEKDQLGRCIRDAGGLRRAITGKHFEDEHLIPLESDATQLQWMAEAYLSAKRNLQLLKYAQFPLSSRRWSA